ncbi:MAG: hypothetical protein Q9208_003547 [Pyrenodesmia sp. 3 TL-2023]
MVPVNDMGSNPNADSQSTGTDPNEWNLKGITNIVLYLTWCLGAILLGIILAIVFSKSYRTRVFNSMTKVVLCIGCALEKAVLGIGSLMVGTVKWVPGAVQKTAISASRAFQSLHLGLRNKRARTQHEAVELQTAGHKNSKDSPASAASPVVLETFPAANGAVELAETQNRHEGTSSTVGSQDSTGDGFGISCGTDTDVMENLEQGKGPSSTLENETLAEQDLSVRGASEDYIRQGLV